MNLDDLVGLIRTCAVCGAGYSQTRDGERAHRAVFGHRPHPEEGPTDDR